MPHTFPPRRFRRREPVEPDAFNETFQAIAGKLGGRLNEQDIDAASLKASVEVASEAYYAVHRVTRESNPRLAFVDPYDAWMAPALASPGGDATSTIDDSPDWDSLKDDGGSDDLSVTFTSSSDTIVVFAQAQHFAWTYDKPAAWTISPSTTCRLQYAIAVDGVPLDNSITGAFFAPDPPPQQWYRASRSVTEAEDSDWRHILYMQNTIGINNIAGATRLICSTQLEPGQHTVSLVARRLPRSDYKLDEAGEGVTMAAYNRRLFVIRIKGSAPFTGSGPSLSIDAVDDGETMTLTNVFSGSLDAARQTVNEITSGNIARGALRHEHIPSLVYGADTAHIDPGSAVPQGCGPYPGFGNDSVDWVTVNDGVGGSLEISGPVGGWRLDNNPGTIVVLANVQLWRLDYDLVVSPAPSAEDIRACAVFALAITNSLGNRRVLSSTEVVVNAHNPNPTTSTAEGHEPFGAEVPLLWLFGSESLSVDDQRIEKIEVLVTYWDGAGYSCPIKVLTQRGSITAFVLKGTQPS